MDTMDLKTDRGPLRRRLLAVLTCVFAVLALVAFESRAEAGCNPNTITVDDHFEWSGKLDALLEGYEDAADIERALIVECLSDFPASQVESTVLAALADPATEVRVAALGTIRDLVMRDAANSVAKGVTSRDPEIRLAVAETLGALGAVHHVETLTNLLSDKAADVKIAAIQALGAIRDPSAIGPLTAALDDDGTDVVVAALEQLGTFGDRTTVYEILEKTRSSSKKIRVAAIDALGALGDPRATKTLVGLVKARNAKVSKHAARAIADIGDPEAVEPMLALLTPNEVETSVSEVVKTLGVLGDPRAVPGLLSLLRHRSERSSVRRALKAIGGAAVPEIVNELSATESYDYQRDLLNVLAHVPSTDAADFLRSALVAERFNRDDVVLAIAQATDREMLDAIAIIVPELGDAELENVLRRWREGSAAIWADVADDRMVRPLVDRYPDASVKLRREMLLFFAQASDPSAVDVAIEEIGNDNLDIKRAAVYAVHSLRDPRAADGLAAALRADDAPLRRQAANALGAIGGKACLDKLLKAARDHDHPARVMATWALGLAVRNASDAEREEVKTFVREVLEDPRHPLSYAVLDVVVTLGADGVDLATLYGKGRISVQRKILEIVGNGEASSDIIKAGLLSSDDGIRAEAAWAAGAHGLTELTPELALLADSGVSTVATNAIVALGRIKSSDSIDILKRRLYDQSPFVTAAAIWSLTQLGQAPETWELEILFSRSKGDNLFVRETILRSILTSGDQALFDELLAREQTIEFAKRMRALSDGDDWDAAGGDDWVVIDLGFEDHHRQIAESAFLRLPDGVLKAAYTDENGKIRVELTAPGRVRAFYEKRTYVSALQEQL